MDNEYTPQISTQFINLQSDFGFKRAFGTERFKPALIRFIQAALGDDISIQEIKPHKVEYHDKEMQPDEERGKRIVYDVYFTLKTIPGSSALKPCNIIDKPATDDVTHHFILEMQNIYETPFEDRMTYYVSKTVAAQGRAGWLYDLDPVILIGITDFDFPHLTRQLVQDFELREKNTSEALTKKLRMLFYSLKQVPEQWSECDTELKKQLYLIKNMEKMDKESIPYKEGEYEQLFDAAESANVAREDIVPYSQSLTRLRSYQTGLDYKFKEGEERGIEKVARNMKTLGFDIQTISQITGLSAEQIKLL